MPEDAHMHGLPQDGMDLDPQILIQVQSNFIGQARQKEVQLEAAIQQLMTHNQAAASNAANLLERIQELEDQLNIDRSDADVPVEVVQEG